MITALQIDLYSLFTNTFKTLVMSSLVYKGTEKKEES